ncbi:MAG: hypothetical protein QXK71_01615 [Pyrobaculum sp.]
MCRLYWEIYELGIPVLAGPSLLAKILNCPSACECSVVIYTKDLDKIDSDCVCTIDDPTFIHRFIWIGGYPHVALEDLEKISCKEDISCIIEKIRNGLRGL